MTNGIPVIAKGEAVDTPDNSPTQNSEPLAPSPSPAYPPLHRKEYASVQRWSLKRPTVWRRLRNWFAVWITVRRSWYTILRSETERAERDRAARIDAQTALETARVTAERLRLELDSAYETVRQRDEEIRRLETEKAVLTSTVTAREGEIRELVLWQERARSRMQADIATEIAREVRAIEPDRRKEA